MTYNDVLNEVIDDAKRYVKSDRRKYGSKEWGVVIKGAVAIVMDLHDCSAQNNIGNVEFALRILDEGTLNERVVIPGGCTIDEVAYVVLRNKLIADAFKYFNVTPNKDVYDFCGATTIMKNKSLKNKKVIKTKSKKSQVENKQ